MYKYEYPRPMVTTDIVVFNKQDDNSFILLIKRKNEPFKNMWALPGGFVDEYEPLIHAAQRELTEETGIKNVELSQFFAYGDPSRDPRGHTISIVYTTLTKGEAPIAKAGDDAKEVKWFNIKLLPELAFDHRIIIKDAINDCLSKD
jgi:8-oxo-dGTP diphosphatase